MFAALQQTMFFIMTPNNIIFIAIHPAAENKSSYPPVTQLPSYPVTQLPETVAETNKGFVEVLAVRLRTNMIS